MLGWGCLAGAAAGGLQELGAVPGLLVVSSLNPSLPLLPFTGILCVQLHDSFEADNETASLFLRSTYK